MISVSYLSVLGFLFLVLLGACAGFAVSNLIHKIKSLEGEIRRLREAKKAPVFSMMAGLEDVISYLMNLRRQQEEQVMGIEAINFWIEKAQDVARKARAGEYNADTPTGKKPGRTSHE